MTATHHGPWCDDGREPCAACHPDYADPPDVGLWLLARLAVHAWYNLMVAPKRQEPLPGLGLRLADRLEVARLEIELGRARSGGGPESVR